ADCLRSRLGLPARSGCALTAGMGGFTGRLGGALRGQRNARIERLVGLLLLLHAHRDTRSGCHRRSSLRAPRNSGLRKVHRSGSQQPAVTGQTLAARMVNMLLTELADVSRTVSQTSARLAKVAALAGALRSAAADEVPVVVAYLSGELPQRQIGGGWAALRSVPAPAEAPSLTVLAVDKAFSQIGAVAGKGSAAERKRLVAELFAAATADEQYFLVRLLSGELRQGALDGVMTDAVAKDAEVPGAEVRRAGILRGGPGGGAQ